LSRRLAARAVISLVVASVLLTDLGVGMWLAPRALAQMAPSYHWAPKQVPFRLRVGDDVDGDWNAYLRAALDDWNQNETVTLIAVDGSTNPQDCQPVTGRVEVCDWWYGTQTGWLGLTQLYFNARGDHIDAATVQLNDSFLYAPNSPYNSDAARRHTICHELGHTMGLNHVTTASCMNNSQEAVFQNLTPIDDDFAMLHQLYAHQDATRAVAQVADADPSVFAPASLPEVDSEEDVMAVPLDEGTTVVTFVTWAAETVPAETTAGTDVAPEAVAPATDLDGDNYPDAAELALGLDPTNPDTDGDGVADGDEVNIYGTDPFTWDSDGDGLSDGEELFSTGTDPLTADGTGAGP